MKKLILLSMVLLCTQSWARTIYLQPGEQHYSGADTVICEGTTRRPDVKWACACFNGNDNIGMAYGIRAPEDLRSAEAHGMQQCWREKNQRVTSVSCHRQNF